MRVAHNEEVNLDLLIHASHDKPSQKRLDVLVLVFADAIVSLREVPQRPRTRM